MNLFKSNTFTIPGNIKIGSKGHKLVWEFGEALSKEDIAVDDQGNYGISGCGCTKREVKDDGIHAVYNDGGAVIGPVNKSFTVYFKDKSGKIPAKVNNGSGMVWNSKLGKTTIYLKANTEL